ncbi:MAG: DUF4340 domain-containing protein [Gammaproteobacteria bacterium]|nr:DUF4340 domain-containing protein [Gammaproteobacteria bacterium]
MNKRLTLNLSLAVVIIVLALLVIFEPGKDKAPELPKLTSLADDKIQHVTIERVGRDTLVFEKQADGWHITQPLQLHANEFRVTGVAHAAQTPSHARFPQAGRDLKQYELNAPKIKLTLDGQLIEFGGVNPLDNRRYVRVGETIHLVADDVFLRANGDAAGFVSTALVPDHAQEISEIKLPQLTVQKDKDSGKWTVTPAIANLSTDDIVKFVDEWRHAQALQVSAYNGTPTGEHVTLAFSSTTPPRVFDLMGKDSDLILGRKDAGVMYQFTAEIKQRLFTLKPPVTETPTPTPAK